MPVLLLYNHGKCTGRRTLMVCSLPLYSEVSGIDHNFEDAYPGYFSLTLENGIKMEATSTRRAGLERFTFPLGSKPYFALDLANDLPASWAGGQMDIDTQNGRITMSGFWGSR